MGPIHQQLRERRRQLRLKQKDMLLKVGMTRQQYQRLETDGNPRLNTLELVAAGLDLALMLIPKERLSEVKTLLGQSEPADSRDMENPWSDLVGEQDDE